MSGTAFVILPLEAPIAAYVPATRRKDRRLIITLLISFGLHAVAAVLFVLLARGPGTGAPDQPTQIEMVMEERKGDARPDAAPPQKPPAQESEPSRPAQTADPVPAPAERGEAARPASDQPPSAPAPATSSQPPRPETPAPVPAPKITLNGTDSPSNMISSGDHVLPAAPDAIFHNRPPEYEPDWAQAGEHGAVIVLVHVTPAGRAGGVDVLRSSGFARLDRSAMNAVLRWRFLPAVKDGQTVASDMTMQFEFGDR